MSRQIRVSAQTQGCYKVRMPRIYRTQRPGEKRVKTIGVVTTDSVDARVREIADAEERSVSYIGEALLLRGLAAYERDGLLKEPEEEGKTVKTELYATDNKVVGMRGRDTKIVANADDAKNVCMFCSKRAKDRLCDEHRADLIGSAKKTRTLVDSLRYGVIELDREGMIVAYNEAESEMSGRQPDEMVSKNFFEVAPCEAVQKLRAKYGEFLKGEDVPAFILNIPFTRGAVRARVSFVRVDDERALVVVRKIERGRKTG